jgi:hypothetical protein
VGGAMGLSIQRQNNLPRRSLLRDRICELGEAVNATKSRCANMPEQPIKKAELRTPPFIFTFSKNCDVAKFRFTQPLAD